MPNIYFWFEPVVIKRILIGIGFDTILINEASSIDRCLMLIGTLEDLNCKALLGHAGAEQQCN
jgi:hypothetical protein